MYVPETSWWQTAGDGETAKDGHGFGDITAFGPHRCAADHRVQLHRSDCRGGGRRSRVPVDVAAVYPNLSVYYYWNPRGHVVAR